MAPSYPSLALALLIFLLLFLCLNNVLVSPQLIKNPIPIRQFTTENNYAFIFDSHGFSMKDVTTRSMITRCNSFGPLYPLLSSILGLLTLTASTNSTLWHLCLGHLGSDTLSYLVSSSTIT